MFNFLFNTERDEHEARMQLIRSQARDQEAQMRQLMEEVNFIGLNIAELDVSDWDTSPIRTGRES